MSDEILDKMRAELRKVTEESIERKMEIRRLEAAAKEMETQLQTLTKERDDAINAADETKAAYEEFTNENVLQKRISELESAAKYRDMMDEFNSVDGVEYHEGVTLDDLFSAAGVDFDALDEIPEDFTTQVIEAARSAKPFLFASSGGAGAANTGEVRQATATGATPTLKAFGAQAAGGGAAAQSPASDPSQTVNWQDPVAINKHIAAHGR